ncbi:MAG: DUF882 domain-containing protein [Timaviella obliquedivisa GSE-PSE-MK23-08B]|jgi:hypothetical protein|nr:DUF882 domain-containing protein [Timaviella obliquedivisa GSE-PSE-MK23-08B]MBW4514188.1 DUF882 domain-containing protein [Timaviella obliquedivisa GSE-PSE-MK23-08B]
MITIQFVKSSFLRLQPKAISDLTEDYFCTVPKALMVGVKAYKPNVGLFIQVTFDRMFKGRNTWLVYSPDIKMEGLEPGNKPSDKNPTAKARGAIIVLPGNRSKFYGNQSILPGGNFTWGEATHGGTRQVQDVAVIEGIIRIAKSLELVREKLGNAPIKINSWYRDPRTNASVGGASQSRHMWGDAVDFVIDGVSPYDIYDRLSPWWGDRGGLASSSVFTHLDARGYEARWDYGF